MSSPAMASASSEPLNDPDLTRLMQRATGHGLAICSPPSFRRRRPGDRLGGRLGGRRGLLHLALAPLLLVTALPAGWATMRRTQLRWASFVRGLSMGAVPRYHR